MNEGMSSLAVCIAAERAQGLRKTLEDNKYWDSSRKLGKVIPGVVAIPVHDQYKRQLLTLLHQSWADAEIKDVSLPASAKAVRKTQAQKLKGAIQPLIIDWELSEVLLSEVPSKWERHGDLIILPSSAFSSPQWKQLGENLWHTVASALSCRRLAQHSRVANDCFRTPQVSMLLGPDGKVVHVDNGIKYSFDVTKCMFSSGNISEKLRVANWDCSNESVVDLYAGIGYFTLPYLVHAKAQHVYACEWNPNAVSALRENLSLNGVQDRCTIYEGDNRQLELSCVADRVNLGLIPSSEGGWRVAVRVLKPEGGVLHIHHNVTVTSIQTTTSEEQDKGNSDDIIRHASYDSDPFLHVGNSKTRQFSTNVKADDIDDNGDDGDESDNIRNFENCNSLHYEDDKRFELKQSAEVDRGMQSRYGHWARGVCESIKCLLQQEKGGRWEWCCEILHIEKVKSYAPHIDHVVLDLNCKPRGVR